MTAKSRDDLTRLTPVTPPGITILENIKALSMTQVDLAERMDRPLKTIDEIIKGKAVITPETAVQLERVIGIPAHFWLTRDARYREYLFRKREQRELKTRSVTRLEML
jgi:addiction module HigA family antidote